MQLRSSTAKLGYAVLTSSSLAAALIGIGGTSASAQLTIQSTGTLSGTIQLPYFNPNFNNRVTRIDTDSNGTYLRHGNSVYQSNYVKMETRADGSLRYFVDFKGIPVVSLDGVLTSPALSNGELTDYSYQGKIPGTKFQGVVQDEFGLTRAFYTGIVTDPKTGQQYQGTFQINGQGPRYSDRNGGESPTVFDFKSDIPGTPTVRSLQMKNSPLVKLTIQVPADATLVTPSTSTNTSTPTPTSNTSKPTPTPNTNVSNPTPVTSVTTPKPSPSTNTPTPNTNVSNPTPVTSVTTPKPSPSTNTSTPTPTPNTNVSNPTPITSVTTPKPSTSTNTSTSTPTPNTNVSNPTPVTSVTTPKPSPSTNTSTPTPTPNTNVSNPTPITSVTTPKPSPSTNTSTPTPTPNTNVSNPTPITSVTTPKPSTSTNTSTPSTGNTTFKETVSQAFVAVTPSAEPNIEFSSGNTSVSNPSVLETSSVKSQQTIGPRSRVIMR
ncbi:hypothetical protein Nos7524_5112 [Nostoc sp. PCC 7524]|uniref:hypothetical protein n=1 Tax=Nostoc sp. (strain ATCC 29411 / PCC 7524) TaxID=28072 RepID=UPI00029EF95F|nr:hypothetical protein [Nostoc sp. PCC 7524]AFY50837.1 hypothetical protein Nos7524_5112 [Nostoc sp. PCC 7524]